MGIGGRKGVAEKNGAAPGDPRCSPILRCLCRRAATAFRSSERSSPRSRRASWPHTAIVCGWRQATAAITAATIAPFVSHSLVLLGEPGILLRATCSAKPAALAGDLTRNRHVGASAELQRLTLLTAASAKSNGSNHSRDDDHALQVHGLLSYPGNRTYSGTGV